MSGILVPLSVLAFVSGFARAFADDAPTPVGLVFVWKPQLAHPCDHKPTPLIDLGLNPEDLVRHMVKAGLLFPAPQPQIPFSAPQAQSAATKIDPMKALGLPVKVWLIAARKENTTAVRMASGVNDVFVSELFKKGDAPAPIVATSWTASPVNQPDLVAAGKVEMKDIVDLSGIVDMYARNMNARGAADLQMVRVPLGPLGKTATLVGVAHAQVYLYDSPRQISAGVTPGLGLALEVPAIDHQLLRFGVAAGPLIYWGDSEADSKSAQVTGQVSGTIELILF